MVTINSLYQDPVAAGWQYTANVTLDQPGRYSFAMGGPLGSGGAWGATPVQSLPAGTSVVKCILKTKTVTDLGGTAPSPKGTVVVYLENGVEVTRAVFMNPGPTPLPPAPSFPWGWLLGGVAALVAVVAIVKSRK